jgi:hypothetical protein
MNIDVIDDLISRITDFAARCYDVALDADQLKPVVNGKLELFYHQHVQEGEDKELCVKPTSSARSQFLTKISVPVNFFDR